VVAGAVPLVRRAVEGRRRAGDGPAQPMHDKTCLVNLYEPNGFATQAVKRNRCHWRYVLLLSDQHGRRMFETVHLQIEPAGGGHGKHGGAIVMFNHFDQASQFQYKTIELLIEAVPQYWEQDHAERQQLGHNVLRMARVGLTPMDPYNSAPFRGVVELN
jgi:hypothetical protein